MTSTARVPRLRRTTVRRSGLLALVALVAASQLSSCGGTESGSGTPEDPLRIVASFYPLQWMAEQVGGDRVEVTSLTKPGAEPHDLELTPSDVGTVQDADVIAYLAGFQPSVDAAVDEAGGDTFDAADATDLDLTFTPIEEGEAHDDEAGTTDPHFWLDPTLMAEVATAFGETLAANDPDHGADYRANAAELVAQLDDLDVELEAGLASCTSRDLVTSHNAFGYLARRYDLRQVGITGLTPEEEPSPSDLAAVADFVTDNDVQTIYFETLASPAVAETIAAETGASTAMLDPLEGLNDDSEGGDYLSIMRTNLATLQDGQPCR